MSKVPRACEIGQLTCCASGRSSFSILAVHYDRRTYKSCLPLGPNEGSYRPPIFGLLRSSRRTGFTICLTDMRRISSVDRKEKEMLLTSVGIECETFMAAGFHRECIEAMQ